MSRAIRYGIEANGIDPDTFVGTTRSSVKKETSRRRKGTALGTCADAPFAGTSSFAAHYGLGEGEGTMPGFSYEAAGAGSSAQEGFEPPPRMPTSQEGVYVFSPNYGE